ncbi:aminotransferase class V-fold PLP-dependent enzyme [Billgrantia montanilacus]|uniref:aminotransferase class V-fold PLP-dependent enzyme n=1 Tax=Billgrantia montanilacus TaxID=2282305 RepID=UPI003BEEBFA6
MPAKPLLRLSHKGKIAIDVEALGIDLLTIAGHKFQASKGGGALYVREGAPIRSVLFGAGHEKGAAALASGPRLSVRRPASR